MGWPKLKASFTHLRPVKGTSTHRSLNNVFVAVRRPRERLQPVLLVPSPTPETVSDGNAYFRIGGGRTKLYRLPGKMFRDSLAPLREMGYERDGIQGAPGFRRLNADGAKRQTDDFRLKQRSPASRHGFALQDPLSGLDPWFVPGMPSIGVYRADERRLQVGVDGRRVFPRAG